MKALVAGWFSFDDGHATAGDVLAAEVVGSWLTEAGIDYEVAAVPPFAGRVDWRRASPADYEIVLFVCGPSGVLKNEAEFFDRFSGVRMVDVNLTMAESARQ
jgi:hypothetical protein